MRSFSALSPQYLRFLLTGVVFTISGPSLFYFVALSLPPLLASFIVEVVMHSIRCLVYNRFVFSSGGSGVRTYLTAAVPISLFNLGLVFFLQKTLQLWQLALLIGLLSATLGYMWSKLCYRYDLSSRFRVKSRY
ncbi:MAG: hypothetical protein RLZZ609_2219 [Cyanobacteriota bacterium]|jgi:hypothetical protein